MPDKPLSGVKIAELAGIGPTPFAGQLLADLGAEVTRIEKPGAIKLPIENRSKFTLELNLKIDADVSTLKEMIADTDILFEGNRPGVMEKLGLGPDALHAINPALIYGRMTGWGQTGPWAQKAGHDINYIGLTGALHAMGSKKAPPTVPINFVGDYGGGSQFLVIGILAALHRATQTGKGCTIDAAIVDGTFSMMGIIYSLDHLGLWSTQREANLLDGSRPFYRCFQTADGGYMAVGSIEPKFYAEMLHLLNLDVDEFGGQNDATAWPGQIQKLTEIFAQHSRAHWEALFDGSDACVTPVLTYKEAPNHPHNKARKTHTEQSGLIHPAPAPRFA